MPFIAGAQPYKESHCSRRVGAQSPAVRRTTGMLEDVVDLVCFSREQRVGVEQLLAQRKINVLARSSSKLRVQYHGDHAVLRDLPGVKIVDEAHAPVLALNTLCESLGLGSVATGVETEFKGRGQIVAVADTGLDRGVVDGNLHPDFAQRVRAITSWAINSAWAPFIKYPDHNDGPADMNTGHGTHVAGLAVGNGQLSEGRYRGVAPEAELVFQSIEQFTEVKTEFRTQMPTGYYLSGRPLDLRQLFQEARDYGARIHVNAWGDPAHGQYTDDSYEADFFLHQNPDAVILFASGNDGTDRDGNREVDRGSLYAPASAKNVIAVGATEGADVGVGMRGTWGEMDAAQKQFRNAVDRQDPISGDANTIALFSGTGPTMDGRIKPDVCAPGTNLVAPRSGATQARGWGMASPMPYYIYYGGTSMATGVAGGFAAVLRQAWQTACAGRTPSGPALKALMILGAKPVVRRDTQTPEPRYVAGFGHLNFSTSVVDQGAASVRLFDETEPGLQTGEQRVYPVALRATGRLKAATYLSSTLSRPRYTNGNTWPCPWTWKWAPRTSKPV